MATTIRLGTRGSLLARTQSQLVAGELEKRHSGLAVELVLIKTTGDAITDRPLHEAGGKGLFTKELELALLANEVDFAVHSYKDVPVTMPLVDTAELVVCATPPREDPRDVLATRAGGDGDPSSLAALASGVSVATGSLRRRCQIVQRRPELNVVPVRGNIDTRLRKLDEGQYDAVILACAGLRRAGLFDASRMHVMSFDEMIPAAGQGALALQCRRADAKTREVLAVMHDADTELCVDAEREIVRKLGGDCHSPIAAHASLEAGRLWLRTAVGARDGGTPVVFAHCTGAREEAEKLVEGCYEELKGQGVEKLLHG
jgi:hydroxymethylbilane synthase